MHYSALLNIALAAVAVTAYEIPAGLQTLYDGVKDGGCKSFIDNRSDLNDGQGKSGYGFCTDTAGAVYISGASSGSGLGDMDVDCDGSANCGGESQDYQAQTAFDSQLQSGGYGLNSLDAGDIPFVVLGTCDVSVEKEVKPLSVVAVVCGGQLLYGIFGDTNGCDDDNYTGEASIALAQLCFPNDGINGNSGHGDHDVLYLAFTGDNAVPGPNDADWTAKDPAKFMDSLKPFGDKLVAGVVGGDSAPSSGGASNSTVSAPTNIPTLSTTALPTATGSSDDGEVYSEPETNSTSTSTSSKECGWSGHCEGATCSSDDDCSDSLVCGSGKCSAE